jgi:hypothetical protein
MANENLSCVDTNYKSGVVASKSQPVLICTRTRRAPAETVKEYTPCLFLEPRSDLNPAILNGKPEDLNLGFPARSRAEYHALVSKYNSTHHSRRQCLDFDYDGINSLRSAPVVGR